MKVATMRSKATAQTAKWSSTTTENMILVSASFLIVVAFLVISAILFDCTGTTVSIQKSIWKDGDGSISKLNQSQADVGHSIMWRYTNEGWKNILPMMPQEDHHQSMIEPIHPLVWSGVIVFGTLGLMVWASDEEAIERLLVKEE